jgi:hypothetical protein
MWQMCSYLPTTLPRSGPEQQVSLMAAKLSASFILETLIHAKEKVSACVVLQNNFLIFLLYHSQIGEMCWLVQDTFC